MAQKHSNKFVWTVVIVVIALAAGLGYYSNSLQLRAVDEANANSNVAEASADADAHDHDHDAPKTPFDPSPLKQRDSDIVIGKASAPNMIVEYSSLSCPHCAHFHGEMLPEIKKQLIDTGKAKHIVRYFPLNLPALAAAQVVECGPKAKRLEVLEDLYAKQDDWAFTPTFESELKKIAATHDIDGAAFDSCIADEALKEKILNNRKEGMEKLHIQGTPSFFINNKPLNPKGGLSTEAIIKAVEAPAEAPAKAK